VETISIIILSISIVILYVLVIILIRILHKKNKDYLEESDEQLLIFKGKPSFDFTSQIEIASCICGGVFFVIYPFLVLINYSYIDYLRRRENRDSEKVERKEKERKQREIKEFEINYQQKKKERIEKVSQLRASGFKATKLDRKKVIDLASSVSKIKLAWVSETTRIPEAEIVIIIDDEIFFEIQGDFIINQTKI